MTDRVHRAVLSNLRYDLQGTKRLQMECEQRSLKSLGHLTRITPSPLFSEFSVHCKWAENLELVSFLRVPLFNVLFRPRTIHTAYTTWKAEGPHRLSQDLPFRDRIWLGPLVDSLFFRFHVSRRIGINRTVSCI